MNYTFFFHVTSPFSNFHPSKFVYKGLTFVSNEQFMMFCKAKLFKDEKAAQKILKINQLPFVKNFIDNKISRLGIIENEVTQKQWNQMMMGIKKIGREVENYDDEIWAQKRFNMVMFGGKEKYNQNPDLKKILMDTGESQMVEASPFDKLSTMQYVIQKLKEEFSLENKRDNKLKP